MDTKHGANDERERPPMNEPRRTEPVPGEGAENPANETTDAVLEVRDLKKHFSANDGPTGLIDRVLGGSDAGPVKAVDGVSFDLHENETLGVVGESGCGKSTMGKSILRLLEPTSGTVRYRDHTVSELSGRRVRDLRRELQMIFQDPGSALNPRMKIKHLIAEPLRNFRSMSRAELDDRIDTLLEQVELPLDVKDRYPHELSGGQQQRVVIARAIALDPEVIVADEPVTGLDVSVQSSILSMLSEIREQLDLSLLFIAHDLAVVRHISDRVMVLYLGHIVERGDSEAVFGNPQHPYTRSLKRAIPRSHPDQTKDDTDVTEGEPPSPADPPSGCPFHPRCPAHIGDVCENEEPEPVELSDGRTVACHHFEAGDDPVPEDTDIASGSEDRATGEFGETGESPTEENADG
jgi:oligopeptide/dipeptide ABC transporter ATP-binding protein